MKIVVEYVFLENFLINLIILKTITLVSKEKGRLFWLSALLGGALTVALPALRLSTLGAFLVQIGLSLLFLCISFKFKTFKKFVQLFLCYFVSAFIYGGACYFFEGLFGTKSMLILLAVITLLYFVIRFLAKKITRKNGIENFCYEVEIESSGQKGKWKAFLDSGNLLFDPLTQCPVTLINFKVFSSLYKDIGLEDILSKKTEKLKELKFAHYIAFNTLNNKDKILVFQVDKLCVGKQVLEKQTVGLTLTNFNQAFGTDVILHNNFALEKKGE